MEVLCLSGYRDSILLKQIIHLSKKKVQLIEINPLDRLKVMKELNFNYSMWPVLKIEGKLTYYGIRSIITYLFEGNPLFKPTDFINFEGVINLTEQLYNSICPIVASKQTIKVKDNEIKKSTQTMNLVLKILSKVYVSEESISYHIVNTILNICKYFGIDISVFKIIEIPNLTDTLIEEALYTCFTILNIPERYDMSLPPTKPMLFTTPIYYVNGIPHIGHVFTTALTECLCSWYKLRGIDCVYSTGTDEHGIKVQTTAASKGFEPIDWCDKTSSAFKEAFDHFDLHPDDFIRTTEDRHREIVYKLWNILLEKGYIYEGKYEGWYSKREETFIPENQVQEQVVDGKTIHINSEDGAELFWQSETNWMFKLSAMEAPLLKWLEENPTVITPKPYYNQVKSMIQAGLNDLSVSRQNVKWGFPVPNDPKQTIYVWIDALTNYLTVSGWDGVNQGRWPCDMHVIGKDILKFHAIYWPAFLIAADIKPFKKLLVHGWWTVQNTKMSKSLNNTLDPYILSKEWGLEPLKYYLLREATLVTDSDYSNDAMLARYNNDLGDVLANLVLRIISKKLSPSMILTSITEKTIEDEEIIENISLIPGTIDNYLSNGQTRLALEAIFISLHHLNKYLTDQKPWTLNSNNPSRFGTVWYILVECLRILVTCLIPFLPQTSKTILNGLGCNLNDLNPKEIFNFGFLKQGIQLTEVPILFPKKNL